MARKGTIVVGSKVRVHAPGPAAYINKVGTVEKVYRADRFYDRRALVRFNGDTTTIALAYLERIG